MDDRSKIAKDASNYIQYTTKKNVSDQQLKIDDQGRICVDKYKKTTINHVAVANNFVKLANVVPMPSLSRKIIQLRLVNPGITITGICLQTGLVAGEVKLYEQEGVNRIKAYLQKTSLQEATDKFNSESAVEYAVKNLNMQGKDNSLFKG